MKWLKNIILSEADEEEIDEPATMSEEDDASSEPEQTETVDEPATMSEEEPDDTDTGASDEPVDSGPEDTSSTQTTDIDEPATMSEEDDTAADEDTGDDTGNEDTGEESDGEESEEEDIEEEPDDVENKENLKKIKLLNEYKELYDIVHNISNSFNALEGKVDHRKTDILDHAERIVSTLLEDILFTISNNFINKDYKTLLTTFYHFKYQLNSIMKVIEFLIQDEEDKK